MTLSLLQEQITASGSILGKTGMRQTKPRQNYAMNIPVDKTDGVTNDTIVGHPTIEFHKHSSLLNRIWQSISHRWLALFLTEHLFRRTNDPWSYQDALVYSFQMMAPCGSCRYDFLTTLVGYCLKFPTHESIALQQQKLQSIWHDPSTFLTYGQNCLSQLCADDKVNIICSCFQELLTEFSKSQKRISYNRDCTQHRRWCMVRTYTFHFWLDSSLNHDIKASVLEKLTGTSSTKKRKVDSQRWSSEVPHSPVAIPDSMTPQQQPGPSLGVTCTGFTSIISSRRNVPESALEPPVHRACHASDVSVPPISDFHNLEWKKVRLITQTEMDQFVKSYLLIHRNDGVDVLSYLSPLEVYSANHLHDLLHCRLSGLSPYYPKEMTGPVVLHIRDGADCFIDRISKSFHIAREPSTIFQEHVSKLPSLDSITTLCKALVSHGRVDNKRGCGQYRINLGNGGQNWRGGSPCKLHGMRFQKELEKDAGVDPTEILKSIGQIAEFCWYVAVSLQDAAFDHPIAPDKRRKRLYASHLNEYLHMHDEVGFEDLTIVVSSLHPMIHNVVTPHKDVMNDTVAGYTRTVAFNMVMTSDYKEPRSIIHFQLICNFRKVIGHHLLPFYKYLTPVTKHAQQYLQKWQKSMQLLFAGKTEEIPSICNRWSFFLDDNLEYETITISHADKHKQTITSEYLLTEVGISRTLSLSMFINPIMKLQPYMKFDQTIEVAFACSYLANPFWFDWAMSAVIRRLQDPRDTYKIGLHPFYDWCENTTAIFGTWQGGPYNRWSPCGGRETIIEQFGAHPNASEEERKEGEIRLSKVITLLYMHIEWINSLAGMGENDQSRATSLDTIRSQCDHVVQEIRKIVPCQFGHFRLGIMTTILSGCGLLKEGRHLRNLMYPMKGAASYKHLLRPDADHMSTQHGRALGNNEANVSIANDGNGFIEEEQHDIFMQYLSSELGFQNYCRDQIECILCESHPMRSLNCRDWFRKGIAVYDCNDRGEYFQRDYGKNTAWVKLQPPEKYELAFVGKPSISYIPFDPGLSCYASNWGTELRSSSATSVRFKGRNTKTSAQQLVYTNNHFNNDLFHHPSMKMADFYVGDVAKERHITSMFVLSDTDGAVSKDQCNDMDDYKCGKVLWKHLLTLQLTDGVSSGRPVAAGCYHMDLELNNGEEVTFFPGHLDKPFVDVV